MTASHRNYRWVETRFTPHARKRSQQRSVPPMVIDLLTKFGTESRRHNADVYSFDKRSRRQIAQHLGPKMFRRIEPKLNCYVVFGDDGDRDEIITVGHRIRRFRK